MEIRGTEIEQLEMKKVSGEQYVGRFAPLILTLHQTYYINAAWSTREAELQLSRLDSGTYFLRE